MFERILVLSPHTDDGELGCGGSIARFIDEGLEVHYTAFSTCDKSVPTNHPKDILSTECKNAMKVLGVPEENIHLFDYEVRVFPLHRQEILEEMIRLNKEVMPDLVLTPSSHDIHQDHKIVYEESLRCFKKTSSIWGYEHPWNNLNFTTDIFLELKEKHIKQKIKVLEQYRSQDDRSYFKPEYIRSLAFTRGLQVDYSFAETFELIRLLIG